MSYVEAHMLELVLILVIIGAMGYVLIFKHSDPETGKLCDRCPPADKSPVPRLLVEAPSTKALEKMTKAQLLDLAKHHGIKLNGKSSKPELVLLLQRNGVKILK